MTRVKICGVRKEEHALAAIDAGADFIGLVFAYSKRQVTPAQAQGITNIIKKQGAAVEVVGVFVNMPAPTVNHIAKECNLDRIQLCGNESLAYCQQIDLPLIKVLNVQQKRNSREVNNLLATWSNALTGDHLYLLDSQTDGNYGGTGIVFDWQLAKKAARQFRVVIAGGLTPENVAQAIEIVNPWGVDTSSGIETDGAQDTTKIQAFIKAVRVADERSNNATP